MAERKKSGVAETVRALAEPYAAQLGLTVWDVRFVREGGSWYLRVFIDKPGGVGITDCENMSRALDGPLDEQDPVPQAYCLEVSSPGLNRELTREEHFKAYAGSRVCVRLIRPEENGNRQVFGELLGAGDGAVTVRTDSGEERSIPLKSAASVRVAEDEFVGGYEE